jgi:hypothetical protein
MNWAAIEGYEGIYAVSDTGEVMSMNYKKSKLPGLMTFQIRRGYASIWACKKGFKAKWLTVHALVAHHFIGPRPDGMAINHKDGVKTNNRVDNLEYCTHSENSKHSFTTGAQCNKGIQHSQAKLDDEKVRKIREAATIPGYSRTDLAREYGVSESTITYVVRRQRWGHVH